MATSDLQISADAFVALARSSPWRWRTLHFRHRDAGEEVEAWLRRPGDLVVRTADGRRHRIHEDSSAAGAATAFFTMSVAEPAGTPALEPDPREGPVFRPDGLVADRRDRGWDDHDDPMWANYAWVAMLDPRELSHHVDVTNLREDVVAGRRAWRADLRALPGYDPRCGGNCCELLYSEAGLMADFSHPDDVPQEWRGRVYPDHHDVALDVETGVVVRLHPVGRGDHGQTPIEIDILEVDADLDAEFA